MAFIFEQHVGETVKHAVSLRGMLDRDDTVTGIPTAVGGDDLVILDVQTNTVVERIGNINVPIGQGIFADISGGTVDRTYEVYFEFDTAEESHRFTNTPITITVVADPS